MQQRHRDIGEGLLNVVDGSVSVGEDGKLALLDERSVSGEELR
jgi:hypothetical protein